MIQRIRSNEAGFTIIEVMVAVFVLLLGVLGVATMADTANIQSDTTKARVGGTNLAREMLEDARAFDYDTLTGNLPAVGANTALQQQFVNAGLPDADATKSGWQVRRRGISYTVTAFTCVADDAHDGARAVATPDTNPNGPYCLGSATPGGTDANPDDYRKVEVNVTWTINSSVTPNCKGANQTTGTGGTGPTGGLGTACVTESELIANPSGGLGPNIQSISHTGGNVESGTSVSFNVVTTSAAEAVSWIADDGASGTATANGASNTQWTIAWPLDQKGTTKDGNHSVTAQAFLLTAGGVTKSATVTLNRFYATTPGIIGGGIDARNGAANPAAVVNWSPDTEGDIIGYTVYRASGAANSTPAPTTDSPVCSTASVSDTLCIDGTANLANFATSTAACPSTPTPNPGDLCLDYYVVPFDTKAASNGTGTYTPTDCPGMSWSSVPVPLPPVSAGRSTAPLTGTTAWSQARVGCPSDFIKINYTQGLAHATTAAPPQPGGGSPTCTTSSDNLAVINWTTSAGAQLYRIYKDGTSYSTSATTLADANATSYKDPTALDGNTHTYYVAAMDSQYAESTPLSVPWSSATCP